MSFGQVSSAVKGKPFGLNVLSMSKGFSQNPRLSAKQKSVRQDQEEKMSSLCAVSDFDADSFI